jgi:hypothetical protein
MLNEFAVRFLELLLYVVVWLFLFFITSKQETTINLSNYPVGLYKAVLVANGAIVDVKILSKQ